MGLASLETCLLALMPEDKEDGNMQLLVWACLGGGKRKALEVTETS